MGSLRTAVWHRLTVRPPHSPPYVLEPVEKVPPHKLGRALGLEWWGSSYWWVGPLWMLAAGSAMAALSHRRAGGAAKLGLGAGYGTLIAGSIVAHQLGTLAGGTLVGAPLSDVVLTATLAYDRYPAGPPPSRRVHLGRALGGPLGNLLVGLTALALHRTTWRTAPLRFLAVLNLLFTTAALAPLPTMDGGVLVAQLRTPRAEAQQEATAAS